MKVPSYGAPKVQASNEPAIRQSVEAPIEAFGGGRANPSEAFGNAAESASKALIYEKQSADKLAAKSYALQFDQFDNDQYKKEKGGAFTAKGKDAVTEAPDKMFKGLQELTDKLIEEAPNDDQRAFIKQASLEKKIALDRKMTDYSAKEYAEYDKAETIAITSLNSGLAVKSYNDPVLREKSFDTIRKAYIDYGQRQGLTNDQVDALINKDISDTSIKVMEAYIVNGDSNGASKFHEKNKDYFYTDDAELRAQTILKEGKLDHQSTALANQIYSKEGYRGEPAINERLDQIQDKDLREATRSKVKIKEAESKKRVELESDAKFMSAAQVVEAGGSFTALPVSFGFTPSERKALQMRQEQIAGAAEVKVDPAKYHDFDTMNQFELSKYSAAKLYLELRPHVDKDQWNTITAKWKSATKAMDGDEASKKEWAGWNDVDDQIFQSMQSMKIKGLDSDSLKEKMSKDEKVAFQQIKQDLNTKALLWSEQNGGKKPDSETTKKLVDSTVMKFSKLNIENTFFDTESEIKSITPEQKPRAYKDFDEIPKTDVANMVTFLKNNRKLGNMDIDSAMSQINKNTGLGVGLRKRIEKAYAQQLLNDNAMKMKILLGE